MRHITYLEFQPPHYSNYLLLAISASVVDVMVYRFELFKLDVCRVIGSTLIFR